MDAMKVTKGLAIGFLLVLLGLIVFIENPEQKRYENAVASLMIHEGLSSSQEVLEAYPELQDIKLKMDSIDRLQRDIHALTAGPAPNVSNEERLQIIDCNNKIVQLQKSVQEKLTQLQATYAVAEH